MKNLHLLVSLLSCLFLGNISFAQTPICKPTLSTTSASAIGWDSVVIGGNVTGDGGTPVVMRGICYSLSPNPDLSGLRTQNGVGIGSFTTVLRALNSDTTYYARSYATSTVGTEYGNEVSFSTLTALVPCTGTPVVMDVDSNRYETVQIGTQCWMRSNLKVSKYRNGNNITNITDSTQWGQTNTSSTGAWCNYNNDANNGTTYGKLYNWYAVNDARGLCPSGWHVPTDAEWTTLTTHLGGPSVAGGKMKSTTGWHNNGNGTNSSWFTALPGAARGSGGGFDGVGDYGVWWSSSGAGSGNAWSRALDYTYAGVTRTNGDCRHGFSVRCARD